ncbi:hypothetical protein L1887_29451 [Cichorium endivia]|nr:hypothetical protein L1887_29451 [Cichorium endivia]
MKLQTVTVEECRPLKQRERYLEKKKEDDPEVAKTTVPADEISMKKVEVVVRKTNIAEKNVYEEVVAKDLAPNEAAVEKRGGYLTVNVVAKVKGV